MLFSFTVFHMKSLQIQKDPNTVKVQKCSQNCNIRACGEPRGWLLCLNSFCTQNIWIHSHRVCVCVCVRGSPAVWWKEKWCRLLHYSSTGWMSVSEKKPEWFSRSRCRFQLSSLTPFSRPPCWQKQGRDKITFIYPTGGNLKSDQTRKTDSWVLL